MTLKFEHTYTGAGVFWRPNLIGRYVHNTCRVFLAINEDKHTGVRIDFPTALRDAKLYVLQDML
eukprot:SAG31_NODE_130_length_23424_cov_45.648802_3_plen_64_part_00